MRSLDVILIENAKAAGREAAEASNTEEGTKQYRAMEKAQDESVYDDRRLDRAARQVLLDAFHNAFRRELGLK